MFFWFLFVFFFVVCSISCFVFVYISFNDKFAYSCNETCSIPLLEKVKKISRSSKNKIPKIIWTFWDSKDAEANFVIKKCLENWKKNNPKHVIVVLNKENLNVFIENVDVLKFKHVTDLVTNKINFQRLSDYVRLLVLKRYGGIWMDASTILTRDLDWVDIFHDSCNTVCFYLQKFTKDLPVPVIESWFIATKKGADFVDYWCLEFLNLEKYESVDDYIKNVLKSGIRLDYIDDPTYLAIHVSAQFVLQRNNELLKDIWVIKAEDTSYMLLESNEWNSVAAVTALCDGSSTNIENIKLKTPLIKLRQAERNEMPLACCVYSL
jgi:hypothetical protein